jgi:D,D-heptose 1,7-bisphosphate phosphatase
VARAVFLDRDGTIIVEINFVTKPDEVKLIPGAPEAIRLMKDLGYKIILCTNQSGIARGYFTESEFKAINQRMFDLLGDRGLFDGIYFCPHLEEALLPQYRMACQCRKPKPGMFLKAAKDHNLELSNSVFIGDTLRDIEPGRQCGGKTILVLTGHGEETLSSCKDPSTFDFVAKDLLDAARWLTGCTR